MHRKRKKTVVAVAAFVEEFNWKDHLTLRSLRFKEDIVEEDYVHFLALSCRSRLMWSFRIMSAFWGFWVLLSILDIIFLYPDDRMPTWGLFPVGFGMLTAVSLLGLVVLKKYPGWCSAGNNSEKLSTAIFLPLLINLTRSRGYRTFQCSFFCFLSTNTYDSPYNQCLKGTPDEMKACDGELTIARWVMFALTLACVPLFGLMLSTWMEVIRQKMFRILMAFIFPSHALRSLILTPLPPSSKYMWCFCFYVVFPVLFSVLFRNNEISKRRLYMLQCEQASTRAQLEDKLGAAEEALAFEAPTAAETTVVERMVAGAGTAFRKLEIPFSELRLEQRIGSGAFGEVIKAEFRGVQVAVKRMLRSRINENSMKMLLAEVQLLHSLVHPNIVEFVGVSLDSVANICLVMELMDRGSLQDALKDPSLRMTWTDPLLKMLVDVVSGISYLHGRPSPVIHRDLKPDNVLVTNTFGCKLTDFGASREASNDTTMTQIGTESYMAPEIIKGMRYDEKVDIYAVGILMIAMHNRGKTYDKEQDDTKDNRRALFASILGGGRPPIPTSFPEALSEIAQACWQESPDKRPSASRLSRMITKLKAEGGGQPGGGGDGNNHLRTGDDSMEIPPLHNPDTNDWMEVPDQVFGRSESHSVELRVRSGRFQNVAGGSSSHTTSSDSEVSRSYSHRTSSSALYDVGSVLPTLAEASHSAARPADDEEEASTGTDNPPGRSDSVSTQGVSNNTAACFSAPREVPNQAVPGLEEMSTIMGGTTILGNKGGVQSEREEKGKIPGNDTEGSKCATDLLPSPPTN